MFHRLLSWLIHRFALWMIKDNDLHCLVCPCGEYDVTT